MTSVVLSRAGHAEDHCQIVSICDCFLSLTGFYEWFHFKNDTTSGAMNSLFAAAAWLASCTLQNCTRSRSRVICFSEPAFYYDFADAALVMIESADLAEGQEYISVKDFCSYLESKGYSVDR